jgi:hypothetical protein
MTRIGVAIFLTAIIVSMPLHAQWIDLMLPTRVVSMMGHNGVAYAGTLGNGLYCSTDQGMHWTNVMEEDPNGKKESVWGMASMGRYLFATGGVHGVYRSSDNGMTWTQNSEMGGTFSVEIAGDTIQVSTFNDGLYRSLDSGSTWAGVPDLNDKYVSSPRTIISFHGCIYIGGTTGVYRTIDTGGHFWTHMPWANTNVYKLVRMGETLLIASQTGLYKWGGDDQDSAAYTGLSGMTVTDVELVDNAMIASTFGADGVVLSLDSGATWKPINDGLSYIYIKDLAVIDGWLYGSLTTTGVWKRRLSEIISGVEEDIASLSTSSGLHIHPNPASERTNIRYTLAGRSSVTVVLYDALGRTVAQPVAGVMQDAGEHQIVLPTDDLAAGVYLCSVNAGGMERTVRFVVVR